MKYIKNMIGASLLLTLSAGAASDDRTTRPLLNSERIARSFGSYGVHIVVQSKQQRASCLYSGTGEDRVCRTLALVRYPLAPDPLLAPSLATIRAGASLGSTLVDAGWQVEKVHGQIGRLEPGDRGYEALRGFLGLTGSRPMAFHIYRLYAARDEATLPVAELVEVHHPDYLSETELRAIYTAGAGTPGATIDTWVADLQAAFVGGSPFN